jgi:hypothetical protein
MRTLLAIAATIGLTMSALAQSRLAIRPDSYQLINARVCGGDFSDVFTSNDARLLLGKSFQPFGMEKQMQAVFGTHLSPPFGDQLTFTLETNAYRLWSSGPNITLWDPMVQVVEFYNYAIGDWVIMDWRTLSLFDQEVTLQFFGPPFVNPDDLGLSVRLTWFTASGWLDPWRVGIDHVGWTIIQD